MEIKWLFRFFCGRAQFAPSWFYKLPKFTRPVFWVHNNSFRWFGMDFIFPPEVDTWGKTLFMVWRDQLTKRAPDASTGSDLPE